MSGLRKTAPIKRTKRVYQTAECGSRAANAYFGLGSVSVPVAFLVVVALVVVSGLVLEKRVRGVEVVA